MTVTLTAVLLVVGCAVAFSLADLLRKLLAQRLPALPLLVALSVGMAPVFLAWLPWDAGGGPAAGYWLPGMASAGLNLVANLAFLVAVGIAPLSLTIPVLSLTPVFTTLLAIPLLGEVPSGRQLAGVALVVAGVFWLGFGAAEGGSAGERLRALARERGSALMALTALCWSLAMPLDKLALAVAGPAFHGLALNLGVGLGALAVLAARGRAGELRRLAGQAPALLALVAVGAVALVLILLAILETWIGFVETMKRGIGSFLAVVWGRLFFAEPVTAAKLAAVAAIAAGVALIVW
jgi:drug/metabolite transporter (DMT)-like permease